MADREFFRSGRLWSRAEVVADPCPVPPASGVYAWFFREIPPKVPTGGCIQRDDWTLLYIGISPKTATSNGTLQSRLGYHMGKTGRENAEGSTLRMTLGCLLSEALGIRLERPRNRFTFGLGEAILTEWIGRNCYVAWTVDPEPWQLEELLIGSLNLPLNIKGNNRHPFCATLKTLRKCRKAAARGIA